MIYPDGAAFSGMWENGVHTEFRDSRPEPPGTLYTYSVHRVQYTKEDVPLKPEFQSQNLVKPTA
jgi:hypothetical protein